MAARASVTPHPFHPRAYLAGRLTPTRVYPRGKLAGGKDNLMNDNDRYLKKLSRTCAILIAHEAGGQVQFDELELAMIHMRYHLMILTAQYYDTLSPKARVNKDTPT